MSSLFAKLWLDTHLTTSQITQIDQLIQKIGQNIHTSQKSWSEYLSSSKGQRPIDKILTKKVSKNLRHALIRLDTEMRRDAKDIAALSWSFEFINSAPLQDTPDANKYKFNENYPHMGISIEHEPLRLISGWGTTEYSFEKSVQSKTKYLEGIVNQMGRLPIAEATIFSKYPYDGLLAGHLALWLLDLLGGALIVRSKTISTSDVLDELCQRMKQRTFPGTIYRFISSYNTPQGEVEYIWHLIDANFLREWIKQPTFNLF